MKVKVIKAYFDKQEHKILNIGDTIEVSEERLAVLKGKNLLQQAYVEEIDGYADMTVKELKAELDSQGIEYDSKAKKADLIKLLEG